MRLARLLLISGLAARAGAEAAADWFPRWASFASDDTPYIHSRGYQTLRTSGSTGAAAAAVLEIVKEDRRKRGDATPVTILFPNKTILEMPLDGDQVDTLPDGTSLIFDSKAFKLGEFSTVLARWHDLSEKDTERIVWFAASGGLWTIRAATILVPLRVVALRIYQILTAAYWTFLFCWALNAWLISRDHERANFWRSNAAGILILLFVCCVGACLVAAAGSTWMIWIGRAIVLAHDVIMTCGHVLLAFPDPNDAADMRAAREAIKGRREGVDVGDAPVDRLFTVRSAFMVLRLLGPVAVVNVLAGEFGFGAEASIWTDARAVLSPFFAGGGALFEVSRISEMYYGSTAHGCAFTAILYCVWVNVVGWMGYSGPWLTCLGLWATLMAGVKRDHILDFFAHVVRFVLTPFNWASARTATSSTLSWVLLAACVVSAISLAYDKISWAAVADAYTHLQVGRWAGAVWAAHQWLAKWRQIGSCTWTCVLGFCNLSVKVLMPWFTGTRKFEIFKATGIAIGPSRKERALAWAMIALFVGAYAAACYYYLHLIAALGWVMCFYDLCYHRKPSDGAIWKRFCLTFPPVADYDAIAAAVATELRIDEALSEFRDLHVAWWSVMMITHLFLLASGAWATAAFIDGRPVAAFDLFTGPVPKFAQLALAYFGVHKAWLYVAGRRCDVAFLSYIGCIVVAFEGVIVLADAWWGGPGRAESKDRVLARLSTLPAGARRLAKAAATHLRASWYLHLGVLAVVAAAFRTKPPQCFMDWFCVAIIFVGADIAFITECSNTGTRDQPTADRPVAARLRPPEPARAPEPDAESEPEIVEADLDSDDERVIERMKARHEHVIERMKAGRAFGEAEVAAREREYAGTRAHVAAAKAFIAACKAERAAADASKVASTAALRFVTAEEERKRQRRAAAADAQRQAAAVEAERRAAAAPRLAAKAERRARAEAEARAARVAEELIAAEEAAAAAAATKRSKKKKKKKGRSSSLTAEGPPPPREEAKDEAPAPAPAARRTLAELVAAEDAPAPPTETPPDSTILPLLQDDVEADPAVAALLAKVGLERLAVDFAREQIDATTLPLLAVEDLVDVGLSTADAERVVAAVAPAPPGPAEVPENLCCPISMELMTQPVISADGFTYDRASIEAWLARGKTTSPTTGAPLAHTHLTPNHLVKSMIAEYQESKG